MADHEDYYPGEAPMAHKASHEDDGSDEISIAGLAGESVQLGAHKILPSIHHVKYTDAEAQAVADAQIATHAALPTVHQDAPALIATHAAIATAHQDAPALILTHKGDASAHHQRFTAAEVTVIADALINTHAALPTVHQDAPALILTHKGDAAAHHAKYTDAEAVSALYAALPAFQAYVTTDQVNVTGDATAYNITGVIWSEIADHLSNFSNGTFTAPVTGLYLFTVNLLLAGVAVAHDYGQLQLITSNRPYLLFGLNLGSLHYFGYVYNTFVVIADMDTDDTAYLCLTVIDGTKIVDVRSGTYFSCVLCQK